MDLAQILHQGRLIRHLEDVRQMVSLRGLDALSRLAEFLAHVARLVATLIPSSARRNSSVTSLML
jgi:hypothetical protein